MGIGTPGHGAPLEFRRGDQGSQATPPVAPGHLLFLDPPRVPVLPTGAQELWRCLILQKECSVREQKARGNVGPWGRMGPSV